MGFRLVQLKNGDFVRVFVRLIKGACLAGKPTAYILHNGQRLYIKPGEFADQSRFPGLRRTK